jgi:tetratricopeptide (TPR) repeat protein
MAVTHLETATLEQFLRDELNGEATFQVGWHLFGCADCRAALEALAPASERSICQLFERNPPPPVPDASSYDQAFNRMYETLRTKAADLERERRRAPELFAELATLRFGQQRLMVRNNDRFQIWGLAELLLERCRDAWNDDPNAAEDLASLALEVAESLTPETYGANFLNDLKAQAWAYIANSRRIRSDLRSVEQTFEIAQRLLDRGTGDPIERAQVLDFRASFLRDQRRFAEAIEVIDQAIATYREAEDSHLAGRSLAKKAIIFRDWRQPEKAIPVVEEAISLIDPSRDRRLVLSTQQNLLTYLTEAGRPWEARRLLPEVRRLAREIGGRLDLVRLRWAEGLIADGLGDFAGAERALLEARKEFVDRGIGYDAAMVSLDLAAVYLRRDRTEETKRLAAEMLPIFEAHDLHREALAALLMFQSATEKETVTLGLVREIGLYLDRARSRPRLRFELPAR